VPLTAENAHAMLCGNPEMVRETQTVLEARGMRRHRRREPGHFTLETYW
jgi:ferredoxin--NADP+ reductase